MLEKLVIDRLLHVHPFNGYAGLAAVCERTGEQTGSSFIQGSTSENNHGILSAKLQRIRNQSLAGRYGYFPPCRNTARESNIIDVPDQLGSCFAPTIQSQTKVIVKAAFDEKTATEH